jgi:hypothetical protein
MPIAATPRWLWTSPRPKSPNGAASPFDRVSVIMSSINRRTPVLVIACGALARELVGLVQANGWTQIKVTCLPAHLHNRPERIPQAVRECIRANRAAFRRIFVAYGDCGTGGQLDRVLQEEGAERLPGAHCYEFLAGSSEFAQLADAEPGTFYLTDFLARHFDRLVMRGLGLDRHPELLPLYFGNYRRLVYLAQQRNTDLIRRAQLAAERLNLPLEIIPTGLAPLAQALQPLAIGSETLDKAHYRLLA